MIEANSVLSMLVIVSVFIFGVGFLSKKFKQPYVIAYIFAGLLLGSSGFGIVQNNDVISIMGSIGIIFLLFFVGMEIDLKKLLSGWKVAIIGTFFQIMVSVGIVWFLGSFLGWGFGRIILFGFVVSLSSTAVVLKILDEWKESGTHAGRNVISILIVQDFAFIPMIIILGLVGSDVVNYSVLALQMTGMILMLVLLIYILRKKQISIPFMNKVKDDHEMQVFLALIICFGLSLLSGLFQLSVALGAFMAGIIISASKETKWVHDSLNPFRIVFVSLFFIYVGLLIDINFLLSNLWIILALVLIVFITNTFINASIMKFLNNDWRDSLYAGALLSQIGEFSFLLASIGLTAGLIGFADYQITIQVIALSLLFSPLWIMFNKKVICHIDNFKGNRLEGAKIKKC